MNKSNGDFWRFSLQLYAQPQVADLCVQLQDTYQLNVNMLLWCCWLEQKAIALTAARLEQAHERVDAWEQEYVLPLRTLRRKLKQQFGTADVAIETLRQQIKQAELLAEKQMQIWLEALTADWSAEANPSINVGANLRCYLQSHQVPNTAIEAALITLNP